MHVTVALTGIALLVSGLGWTPPLAGQAAETTAQPSILSPDLVGQFVRVVTPARSVDGTLQQVFPASVVLGSVSGDVQVSLGPGDSVWVRGNRARSGAWTGAAAGVALTAAFCIETFDECGLDVGLLVVTPFFALIGAGFGSLREAWTRVLP
ncbi:MAG: hypothetical protein OEO23_08795 [Gemmatimonadota bacterium]|nr:hypothetical protein [Gemmatimonadota bacterium]